MSPLKRRTLPLLLAAGCLLTLTARAADWPHWLGPNYNGSSPETTLSGNNASNGSCDRSSLHAKNLTNGLRFCDTWSRMVPHNLG